ncbi:DUF5694 domain-containing protein [Radiobacillus kanasensis]|uniref:DUF5694 domain-containing protein n=1 Tax=Radiobacillus kanasensis TaxID=2844358 RepID=UPI001E308DFB|nr:DUF5694 domain-containing protein [Radiobacillus kanasensis]UFT98399.1 DUF5694 domain-containing protein [Radiobacillus kanasensis]
MQKKNEVILLGTFHFEQDEEIVKQKEDEIIELVEYLSIFKPTKIALEWERDEQNALNKLYKESTEKASVDEIQQIGFRLAKKLLHEDVYAINWTGEITQEEMTRLINVVKNGYPELWTALKGEHDPELKLHNNVMDAFKALNHKDIVDMNERLYLSLASVDAKGEAIGLSFINKWMKRELQIFNNILEVSEDSDERVLVVIGSDHLWLLRKWFEGHGWKVQPPF